MANEELGAPAPPRIGRVERRKVQLGGAGALRVEPPQAGRTVPLTLRSMVPGVSLVDWAGQNRELIDRSLAENGAVLFRGFEVGGLERFSSLIQVVGGKPEEYTYRSTPRTDLGGGVYTSTEFPAYQSIPFHNENSYTRSWPLKLLFYCEVPAAEGGATPIADSARVYERIPAEIRERFAEKKVMYVRNYGEGVDLPWQEVFQTSDRAQVEAFCRDHDIQLEWKDEDRLRTRQVCQAVARHPGNGKMLWFNQAHLFHVSSLEPAAREALLEVFAEEDLPRNTFYGDGSRIDPADLEPIREAYAREEVAFPWEREDVLLLDNMAVAHARHPFKGERKIRVGMTEPFDSSSLQQ
ncbi:MAG TPA: TauD/TfdA family dioxygenase [Longimicrobiaceae bacterium]|nr:TauD/TfdA family dioxygenase [Longimicrobiaceae bacterium]